MKTRLRFSWVDAFFVTLVAIASVFWTQARAFATPFDTYPKLVSIAVLALSILCLIQERLKSAKADDADQRFSLRKATLIAGIALYIVCIGTVGYFVSTYAYLVFMLQSERFGRDDEFLETRPLAMDSIVALGVTSIIALVFKYSLDLIFPQAWLF